jgi:hypothetical protein
MEGTRVAPRFIIVPALLMNLIYADDFLFATNNMKTILVDAYKTLFTEEGVDQKMLEMLNKFENDKIVLTNANPEQMIKLGIDDSLFEVFSLSHEPNKADGGYYEKMLETFDLEPKDCVYFEHNLEAVQKAREQGILSYHFDHEKRDLDALQEFISSNI